ncbi:helix-turn-helix domain-containing protein [Paenibacillus ehimensis]|uniref:Helix-turn-helix domain-containing protein n=1 Tax=Paenibacillus ehimensis TaxID=79264 RepID=A0ABT8VEQ7_9BACL|nr:helix-turn-helix domain-containing protein [Paenibacillus ehimensis]MDO3679441.1 helix-turn-helix domain-containing protein [Paenibacillus ehimensis]MEC0207438.1 helix-turn-helix domain-containing protein [Paenibacillus ehimensis]
MVDILNHNKTISDIIFQLRKEKNLTYAELEKLTGVGKPVLQKLEKGSTKRPEFKTVKAITSAFPEAYQELIECYIRIENRTEVLYEVLQDVLSSEEPSLASKVALRLLENPSNETEDALQRLYYFTQGVSDSSLRLELYNVIVKYSRKHGVMNYIAKGLLQKYLIERLDLKRLEQTFQDGLEIIHYIDFLSNEEKVIYYFRMGLHAHNTKKYRECIEFCENGMVLEKNESELKARAHLSMINSYSALKNYDKVEELLDVFEKYEYDFVYEAAKHTRAVTKARKGEYEIAVPLLEENLRVFSPRFRLNIVDELFEIYLKIDNLDACSKLLEKENEIMNTCPDDPNIYRAKGKYYRHKGHYQLTIGVIDEGVKSFASSLQYLNKINAFEEKDACMREFFYCLTKNSIILNKEFMDIIYILAYNVNE